MILFLTGKKMPLTFFGVSAAFNFNQLRGNIMPESSLKNNEDKSPPVVQLDAVHLCNFCVARTDDTWPLSPLQLDVRLHGCNIEPVEQRDYDGVKVVRCEKFLCRHAANAWDWGMSCELAPCVCLGRAAA